jgi:hypothetical protein
MIPRRWPILITAFVGATSIAMLAPAHAKALFNIQGADGQLRAHGSSVNVPIRFLCPKDENTKQGGKGVVIDVSLTQEDSLGRTLEGEAESVPVICNDSWRTMVINVPLDTGQSTGPAFVKGPAQEKAVLDAGGVDVATTPTGKDGSYTVRLTE